MDPKGTLAKRVLIVAKRGTSQGTGIVAQHANESVQNVISMVIMLVVAKEGKAFKLSAVKGLKALNCRMSAQGTYRFYSV